MDPEKRRIFLRKSAVESAHFGSTKLFGSSLRRHLEQKKRFICMESSGFLSLSTGKLLHIAVDARSSKRKYLFGETKVNFIYLRSLRILGSLPMMDLEREKLHLEKEK